MTFQKVTEQSYGSRIINSFKGILAGIVCLILGTGLLFWNEGRAVHTGDTINEAKKVVVEMPNITTVDPSFDGKLVFAVGSAATDDMLTDSLFGVSSNAVSLARRVEYYQWVETSRDKEEKQVGGSSKTVKTYDYNAKWVDKPVDSAKFQFVSGHENTTLAQINNETLLAPNVSFGAYKIPDFLKASIGKDETVSLSIPAKKLGAVHGQATVQGDMVYIGASPQSPKVGDLRIKFIQRKPCEISLIAAVTGDTFTKFKSSNGGEFYQIKNGSATANEMFTDAQRSNAIMTWILRGIGTLLVMIGLGLIFAPLSVLADVIPFLGNIIGAGTGFIAILLGLAWSFVVIAVAWVVYRPLIGISLLVAAIALIILLYKHGHKKRLAQQNNV